MTNAETNDNTATVEEQGALVAPRKTASKKAASRKKGAPKSGKTARRGKPSKPAAPGKKATEKQAPRRESASAKILELIGRPKGATLAEIQKATGWQAHSVRGFISTAGKKHGLRIESSKNDSGNRIYRAAK